jgi:Putative beta-barrel porin-2, OmpL-like. bbp2
MYYSLLLGSALVVGQPGATATLPVDRTTLQIEPIAPKDGEKNNDGEKKDNGDSKEPEKHLFMKLLEGTCLAQRMDAKKIQITGWTEGAFTASSVRYDQLPMGFNYRANEFLLQQNWLRIEKQVDQAAKEATFGFRFDTILPGSDYRFTMARGLWDSQLTANNGEPNTYGIDPVQFYVEGYFPNVMKGLDVKFGRFFAQYGQESIDTTQNQLASHSYSFIYDPFTHVGLLTTLQIDDAWSVQNGIVMGCDNFIDPVARPCYIGSIKWAPKEGSNSLLFGVILGSDQFDVDENFHNPHIFDLVFTHKFNDKLTYTLDALYGCTLNVPSIGFANWFSVVNYLTCQFDEKLSATTRLEFFNDLQGQRTGFSGLYTAITAGVNYKPKPWLALRPEVRYDYNGDSTPFQGKHGVFTAAFDAYVRW